MSNYNPHPITADRLDQFEELARVRPLNKPFFTPAAMLDMIAAYRSLWLAADRVRDLLTGVESEWAGRESALLLEVLNGKP